LVLDNPIWGKCQAGFVFQFYSQSDTPFSEQTSPANIDGGEAYSNVVPLTPR
jgi:hypothetical protein